MRGLLVLWAAGLSACAVPGPGAHHDLAYQKVVPGARLTLNGPIQIPARQAHVDLQGSWVGRGATESEPYCILEIDTVADGPQTVAPDSFEIWKVGRSISPGSDWGSAPPMTLAGLGLATVLSTGAAVSRADYTPSQIFYKTRFWLRSASQPSVRLLTCQWDQMTPGGAGLARHLTLAEVRQALGPTFTLSLPGEAQAR